MDWIPNFEDVKSSKIVFKAVLDEAFYHEVPTIEVDVAVVDTLKHVSKIMKALNEMAPVPSLQHLKRVKRTEKGAMVILGVCHDAGKPEEEKPAKRLKMDENPTVDRLKSKGFKPEELGVCDVVVCQVPELAAKTRAQYEKSMRYWPVNFHPEKRVEDLVTGSMFDAAEYEHHASNMRQVMEEGWKRKRNAVLVVDFASKEPIAKGWDRTEHHPVQHAVMVAVDAVASTHKGGCWKQLPFEELTFGNETTRNRSKEAALTEEEKEMAPYLCTGYDLYVLRECCVMCAMALVHSRVRRVFFHVRDPQLGAFVSKCQIHAVKDLNHHYEVFEVILETDVQRDSPVEQRGECAAPTMRDIPKT